MAKRIRIIACGGTISSVSKTPDGLPVPSHSGQDLVKGIEGLSNLAEIEVENYSRVLSSQLTVQQLYGLARRIREVFAEKDPVDGVVVTHGTGAMEESAWMADLMVDNPRPVVFTGAMRSASDPFSEGPFNLYQAIRAATAEESYGRGVLVVMNGVIHSARDAVKTHTTGADTFRSGEYGPLGYVYPDRVAYYRRLERRIQAYTETPAFDVDLIKFVVGMDARHLRASAEAGAKGIVIEGSGLGNLNDAVMEGVDEVIHQGVTVVVCSRSPQGRTYPAYGTNTGAAALLERGCLLSSLPGPKTRILLMLLLGSGRKYEELQRMLDP